MNQKLMEIMTDAGMYRSAFGENMPVYPRHYTHFSVAYTGEMWLPAPLQTDEDVAGTIAQGTNLERAVRAFMAYYEDRTGKCEPRRQTFDLVFAYLIHYVFAPAWTKAYDAWREARGRGALGLTEMMDDLGKLLLEVETPAEMLQFVERALSEGVDPLSPATPADVDGLIRMQRPSQP